MGLGRFFHKNVARVTGEGFVAGMCPVSPVPPLAGYAGSRGTFRPDVSIVGKLAMFGDRIMRSKAKQVEGEFTKNLQEKLRCLLQHNFRVIANETGQTRSPCTQRG